MKILLLISFLSLSAFCSEKYPPMKDEVKSIEDMINKLESDVDPVPEQAASTVQPQQVSTEVKASSTVSAVSSEPVATATQVVAPVPTPSVSPSTDEIKSYVDEKPGKKYNKQIKIIQGLSGPSGSGPESAPRETSLDRTDVFDFAYTPPFNMEGFNEEGVYDGKFGHLVFSIYGDYASYYKVPQTRSAWGVDVQVGGQFDLSPFALAILMDGAARGSNVNGAKIYGVGPRIRASYRANSWIFPFLEGGVEFAKVEKISAWVSPFTVIGGGVMFRFGKVDRKSEYSLHRDYGIAQMLVIIAVDAITSPQRNVNTPSCALVKAGFSFELF